MRTLSSTVSTREEAEAVSARLQAIGVVPDGILLRDLAETGDGPAAQGIFISAKVAPEQVNAASDILKGSGAAPSVPEPGPLDAPSARGAAREPAGSIKGIQIENEAAPPLREYAPPARPLSRGRDNPGIDPAPDRAEPHRGGAPQGRAPAADRPQPIRLLLIFSLIIVAGLVTGYLLGQIF